MRDVTFLALAFLLPIVAGCGGAGEETALLVTTTDGGLEQPAGPSRAEDADHPHWHHGHVQVSDACTCAGARVANGWCGKCGVGYVAGLEISSELLFEEIDAHGHDIDPAAVTCPSCRAALASDGFCTFCQWGFVDEELYFSELTWILARGRSFDRDELACGLCRDDARRVAWCDACGVGRVGSFAFSSRAEFDRASVQLAKLREALETLDRCEMCAVVMFTGGACPTCAVPSSRATP